MIYKVAHDIEKGQIWRGIKQPVPEIFWLDDTAIPLTEPIQKLIFQLNQPGMTPKRWRTFLGAKTAVANSGGFGLKGDPRADFINRRDLNKPLPRAGKCYTFGGAYLSGTENNGCLTVETIDITKPLPSVLDVFTERLYSLMLIVDRHGRTFNFPYRGGFPVYWPLLSNGPVRIRLDYNVKDKPIPYVRRA